MPVLLQTFGLSVALKKLVHRDGSQAAATAAGQDQIDLTPYLSENDTIRTVKTLNQPGGGFTVTFADQQDYDLGDTIYALFEPMDLIEIRASRHPEDYNGQPLPLIMRGFISSVQRAESIGDDGTPQRQVIVRGIDSGKLWQIQQVLYQFLALAGTSFVDFFGLAAQLGFTDGSYPVGEYMQKLVEYMNGKVLLLSGFAHRLVPGFSLNNSVTTGNAYLGGLTGKYGPLWTYVETFADRPWNEAFIIDEEAGPVLVFRPTPYKDLTSGKFLNGAADPGTIDVGIEEVLSLSVARSDARVANVYWCPPMDGSVDSAGGVTAASIASGSQVDKDYPNDSPALYGEKMMECQTALWPDSLLQPSYELPVGDRPAADQAYITWTQAKAQQLRLMNRDNAVLEEGSATVNGNEFYVIGKYLSLTRGDIVSESYINQVAHTIAPLRNWTTMLGLERGTGFYQRDQNSAQYPFFAEKRDGPYTP